MIEPKGRATQDNPHPFSGGGPQTPPAGGAERPLKSPPRARKKVAPQGPAATSAPDLGGAEGAPPADREWVLARLKEVAERCLQAVPPPGSGADGGLWKFDAGGAIRALTLLGKHLGLFDERAEPQAGSHEDALDELE